jgi:hypothetical protein
MSSSASASQSKTEWADRPAMGWLVHTLIVLGGGLVLFGGLRNEVENLKDAQHDTHVDMQRIDQSLSNVEGQLKILVEQRSGRMAESR